MLSHQVQKLVRKTLQLLLHNNKSIPALLHWAIDQCYGSHSTAQQQCFHALANILAYKLVVCIRVTVCVCLWGGGGVSSMNLCMIENTITDAMCVSKNLHYSHKHAY